MIDSSSRRIFVILDGRLSIAEPGVNWTHLQYMIKLGIATDDADPAYERAIRGNIINGHVTCYAGARFHVPELNATLASLLRVVAQKCGLPDDTIVHFGVNKGQPGTPWRVPNGAHKLEYVKWPINPPIRSATP